MNEGINGPFYRDVHYWSLNLIPEFQPLEREREGERERERGREE